MITGIIGLCIYALILLVVVLIVVWVARMFGVPENIIKVIMAIAALIFLLFVVNFLLGGGDSIPNYGKWRN
jgi:hypothetical protein